MKHTAQRPSTSKHCASAKTTKPLSQKPPAKLGRRKFLANTGMAAVSMSLISSLGLKGIANAAPDARRALAKTNKAATAADGGMKPGESISHLAILLSVKNKLQPIE